MLLSKLEYLRFEGDERRRSALESLQWVASGFLGCRTLNPFRTGDPARIQAAAPSGIWGKAEDGTWSQNQMLEAKTCIQLVTSQKI